MKRIISLAIVLLMTAMFVVPLCCAAASDADAQPVPELDKDFNVDMATTLIIIICSVIVLLILTVCIVLAKRNIHN